MNLKKFIGIGILILLFLALSVVFMIVTRDFLLVLRAIGITGIIIGTIIVAVNLMEDKSEEWIFAIDKMVKFSIQRDPSKILCRYWILEDDSPTDAALTLSGAKRIIKKLKQRKIVYKEETEEVQER